MSPPAVDVPGAAAHRIDVPIPSSPYQVLVGRGLLERADGLLPAFPSAEAVAVVRPPAVAGPAAVVAAAMGRRGHVAHVIELPPGEAAKRLDIVAHLYRRMAAIPMHRADPVIAVGGGATTDAAGFAAATWLRGVPLVNVPTTVLGMVDAALGGKTGVDLPEGKNLVGAFHQPVAVLADLDALTTLPEEEVRSGLAEVVKAGLVGDVSLLRLISEDPAGAVAADPAVLQPLIERAVAVKARVVAADEREGSLRAVLNYGHTLAHALELLDAFAGIRHGEAVALGMVFAARVSEAIGLAEPGLAAAHVRALAALGLPVGGVRLDPGAVLDAMATDKKHAGGLRLVLLRELGQPEVVQAPDRSILVRAIESLVEVPA